MIASGEKKEEYRGNTQYWTTRLIENYDSETGEYLTKHFDKVRFRHGYAKNAPIVEVEFIEIRVNIKNGNSEWGWDGKPCFGIVLGEIITFKTYSNE